MVKVDRRIRWHYTTTILRLRIVAGLTRYRNCKFHNFACTISRHADGIIRYSVSPSAGPLLPLTVSCFSKIQIGFTFLVPAHPGSPGQRAVKRVCVCATFLAYFSKVRISHIFLHKLAFRQQFQYYFCFCYLLLLDFVTSSIWLPTEWHHPCVRTPVEREGVVGFKQFCTIFPHISD